MDRDAAAAREWPQATLLSSLDASLRDRLLNDGSRRRYEAGTALFIQGDESYHAVLILAGVVKLTAVTETGQGVLLGIRALGSLIGVIEAIDGGPRVATAEAASTVDAVVVGSARLRSLLEGAPRLAAALTQDFARQLRRALEHQVQLSGSPVHQRVAHVLLDLAQSHGQPNARSIAIAVGLSQPELGSLVGAAPISVHRALTWLRHAGVISTDYRRINVLDLDRLAVVASTGRLRPPWFLAKAPSPGSVAPPRS